MAPRTQFVTELSQVKNEVIEFAKGAEHVWSLAMDDLSQLMNMRISWQSGVSSHGE